MSWNYRVIQTHYAETGETLFGIHEVYYTADGSASGFTSTEVGVIGDSLEEIGAALDRMREALAKPVLTPADFPSSG
jgi:hypothetical protein